MLEGSRFHFHPTACVPSSVDVVSYPFYRGALPYGQSSTLVEESGTYAGGEWEKQERRHRTLCADVSTAGYPNIAALLSYGLLKFLLQPPTAGAGRVDEEERGMGKEEEDAEQHANNRTIKGDVPSIFSSTKPKAITEAFLFLLIDHALSSHRRASSNLFPNELEPFQHFLLSWPPFCLSLRSSGNICEKRYKKSSATSKRKENSLHGHLDNSTRKISTQKLPNRPTRHCFFAKVENFTRLLKTCPQRHKASRCVYH